MVLDLVSMFVTVQIIYMGLVSSLNGAFLHLRVFLTF